MHQSGRRWAIAVLCIVLLRGAAAPARAGDWTGFLGGPYRSACVDERGLLAEWPGKGPSLAWEAQGLGYGHSEVLVVGDAVFTCGTEGRDGVLQSFDLASGKGRWKIPTLPANASTPAYDSGRLFVLGRAAVACHDSRSGAEVWRADLHKLLSESGIVPAKVVDPYYASGYVQSPLVFDGIVVVVFGQPQALVIALETATGKLRWISKGEKQASGRSWSSASLIACGKRQVILAPCTGDLVAIDPATGKVLWEERVYPPERSANGYIYTWACPPVFADGLLFAFAGYKETSWSTYRVAVDGTSVERAWHKRRLHPNQENVVVVNGQLYGSGSIFSSDIEENPDFLLDGKPIKDLPAATLERLRATGKKQTDRALPIAQASPGTTLVCQDLKTGMVLGARGIGPVVGHSHHMITCADGRLYVAVSNKPDAVHLIDASPKLTVMGKLDFGVAELLQTQPVKERWGTWMGCFVRPQVAHGRLFIRVLDKLRVYDLRSQVSR